MLPFSLKYEQYIPFVLFGVMFILIIGGKTFSYFNTPSNPYKQYRHVNNNDNYVKELKEINNKLDTLIYIVSNNNEK